MKMSSYNWDAPPPSWRKRSMIVLCLLAALACVVTAFVGLPTLLVLVAAVAAVGAVALGVVQRLRGPSTRTPDPAR